MKVRRSEGKKFFFYGFTIFLRAALKSHGCMFFFPLHSCSNRWNRNSCGEMRPDNSVLYIKRKKKSNKVLGWLNLLSTLIISVFFFFFCSTILLMQIWLLATNTDCFTFIPMWIGVKKPRRHLNPSTSKWDTFPINYNSTLA